MGDVSKPENKQLADLSLREKWVLVPLVVLMIVMGVYPIFFTSRSQPALDAAIRHNRTVPFESAPAAPRAGD
jgi:NADH:ubiquinone oxidoreductase subunit 4 (subunit M)